MRETVLKTPLRFHAMRTDAALCISFITEYPWLPNQHEVIVVSLVADSVWQTLPLLKESIAWACKREAAMWRFGAELAEDCAPLMRRLGIPQDKPRYKLLLQRRN